MVGFLAAKCDPCDALILEEIDPNDPEHVTCKSCGAKLKPFTAPGTLLKGEVWREGVSKSKGWLAKVLIAFRPQHNRNGALARHERIIDRRNNHYSEQVTLLDSGEVVHRCDEPLSDHQGHGSAKTETQPSE